MLLVIPVYLVMFKLGLLGSYAGIVLFLALGPLQFFLFEQFFRKIPVEVIEAALIDGAGEWRILTRVVLPMAMPVTATVTLITFLLNWAQWFPIMVISRSPDTYTLPVALLSMNSELGANFQGIMALAVLTTLPVAVLVEPMRIVWTPTIVATMAWSVLALSIGAISLLLLLIRHGAVARSAALIYLVPPAVAVEAFLLFGEWLAPVQIAGAALAVLGVALATPRRA
jgi:drug/metabolite transporter (DMT)-like permease